MKFYRFPLSTTVLAAIIAALALMVWQGRFAPVHAFQDRSAWAGITLEKIEGEFVAPVFLTAPADGTDRLFVLERAGQILVRVDGEWQDTPFLDISDRVAPAQPGNECGMMSMAFPPDYGLDNPVFYVYYTGDKDLIPPAPDSGETNDGCDTVIARFTVDGDPNVVDPATEEQILLINQPTDNHNGGQVAFSPVDGHLYISIGDGSYGADPDNAAQRLNTRLGKILRIDVSGTEGYTVPEENPFIHSPGVMPEVWAYGLRNPYRFSFDRETGDLYIADVGQNAWEEVNFHAAGRPGGQNYGWHTLEGPGCFNPPAGCTEPADYEPPVYVYPHDDVPSCKGSVTGGYVYRGENWQLQGTYFFADFCRGVLRGLRQFDGEWLGTTLLDTKETDTRLYFLSFGEDEAGNLYVTGWENFFGGPGAIYQVKTPPIIGYVPGVASGADVVIVGRGE